ncbi:MAG: hypothetical protein DRH20_06475 [Deltaproteobacteria bacterium]|nr:MAG: hypothetical protein DRH20_06475 [Deltaproteobacteria bacterium]
MISNLAKVVMPLAVGILFIISFFFADRNEFFNFLAYFPRKREGSIKIGSLIFGIIFVIVALYNFLRIFFL